MANITAADVNKLRKMTGAGMMDCKKALQECDGDFEKATDYLRKKGQKIASKRADKDANEGLVIAKVNENNDFGVILMVNCETDFVAKNQDFSDFVNQVVDLALNNRIPNRDELMNAELNGLTVEAHLTGLIGKIGEKMQLAHYDCFDDKCVFAYNHQGNRLSTLLGMNVPANDNILQVGHEVAMQVAAMSPVAVDKDDVAPAIVEREKEIGREQALQEGKPENIVDKIALGKLNKFFKENTLLNQDFVRDTKKTVGQYLKEVDKDLTVTRFKRYMLGE